jgi:hypothetical protein
MGANFETMNVDGGKTRAEVKSIFESAQDQDRYENGHSYSGGFGMASGLKFVDRTWQGKELIFETEQDADTWLSENCQKWEEAQAVKFRDKNGKTQWMIGAWCSS